MRRRASALRDPPRARRSAVEGSFGSDLRGKPVFARLGPWCHDRRKLVLALWIAALVVANGIAGSVGGGLPAGLHARGLRVHRGLRAPRGRVRERPRLAELGHDRVRSGGRHHRPGRAPAGRGPAGRGCRHRAGDGGGEPVRPGRGAPHLHAGRGPGHDRRRHRLPARGRRLRRGERGERAHPRARRRARRRAGGGRRLPVRRARGAEVRAVRPGLRHRHPHRCARCGRRGAAPGSG